MVGRRERIHTIVLIGGEPLCHPYFERLAYEVLLDFPSAVVKVATNGLLVPELAVTPIFTRLHFTISEYPGSNDAVIRDFAAYNNVDVWPFGGFHDPYRDPQLSDDMAKAVRRACNHMQVRIVGTRLYNCCVAEGVERYYNTEPVHVKFDKDWRLAWSQLPTWKACQHCFWALDYVIPRMDHAAISEHNHTSV